MNGTNAEAKIVREKGTYTARLYTQKAIGDPYSVTLMTSDSLDGILKIVHDYFNKKEGQP